MTLNRSKVIIYLDMLAFIISSIVSITTILSDMIGLSEDRSNPANIFVLIYMINLLFYRICMEIKSYKLFGVTFINVCIHILSLITIVSTLLLITYLAIMAYDALWGYSLIQIITNHITYATIVGSWFVIHLASDSMIILYNTYMNNR
jgi:hypothetical protein